MAEGVEEASLIETLETGCNLNLPKYLKGLRGAKICFHRKVLQWSLHCEDLHWSRRAA